MIKKILKPVLISLIQIVIITIIHSSLYYFFPIQHKSIAFGFTIFYSEIIFIVSILTFNFYLEFYKKNIYLIGLVLLIITSIFPLMAFDYRPLRSLFLIILYLCVFISSLILIKGKIENRLESKKKFYIKIKNYFTELSESKIPLDLLMELIDEITDSQYHSYQRFWHQYPKSRKRYSKFKLEDLDHPFTQYKITDFFRDKDSENYKAYTRVLLKMTEEEFSDYEMIKYQYEAK